VAGPLYRQIAKKLRSKIESGMIKPGDQLPTEDVLMEEYHTSRNTVRAALRELATRGLIDTQHGKGTFVIELVSPIVTTLTTDPKTGSGGGEGRVYTAEVAKSGRTATVSGTRVELGRASALVASSLDIPDGTYVVSRHQKRYVDNLPWSLQISYYPMSLSERAPRLREEDSLEQGTVAYLAGLGITQAGYRDAIEVRSPDDGEANYFDIEADGHIKVVVIHRTAFDQNGVRIRFTVTVYRADRNRFAINVGEVPVDEIEAAGG
jgi:GntR family transcriptional regulator